MTQSPSPYKALTCEVPDDELQSALFISDAAQRVYKTVEVYSRRIADALREEEARPDVWYIVIPDDIYRYCRPKSRVASDLAIEAEDEEWNSLLAPMPRPFYHDLHAATVHHGFAVSGNTLNYCAYYPALRRLIELMREVRNE